jgi:peptidoglycan/xylan/chitin deacetylase (PgdA/CDA1 family)
MKPRERLPYSAIVDREPLKLPGDARVVVWPIVNIENWDIDGPMPRTVLSPPGGKNMVPDLPNWAWQEYGMRIGFWRILEALESRGIKATLSINGSVCEIYPRLSQAAHEAGWEFMAHSYIQKPMHLLDDERAAMRQTIEAIVKVTGKKPRGWLGPGLTETFGTPEILVEEGFEYVADWVLDDQPLTLETKAGKLYSIPYTVELNDIPMMMLQFHKAVEFYERSMDQFERLYAEGEHSARIMAIAVHPYISGVPYRIKYFERVFEELSAKPGVLFWTGDQILDWYKEATGAA